MDPALRYTIARVAREEGIDPAYALAVAERESNFNPSAGGRGSIRGLYQFTGANRRKYGLADNASVEDQTRAFAKFTRDLKGEMAGHLGRDPSHGELYTGHHFGGARAARIASGQHAGLAPSDLFSANEMAGNPHFAKARTGGELSQSIVSDIDRRMAKHGGGTEPTRNGVDFAQFGQPLDGESATPGLSPGMAEPSPAIDFAQFGQAMDTPTSSSPSNEGRKLIARPGTEVDLAQFGMPASIEPASLPVTAPARQPAEPSPGKLLGALDDEMSVRLNAPDPNDAGFQNTVRKIQQPQPQGI